MSHDLFHYTVFANNFFFIQINLLSIQIEATLLKLKFEKQDLDQYLYLPCMYNIDSGTFCPHK